MPTQEVTPGGCEGALGHDGWRLCTRAGLCAGLCGQNAHGHRTVQQTWAVRGVCEWALKPRRSREGGSGKVMVANRTREIRLSGMTRGAYGNVDYG
jgi:hypothetical protein